MSAKRAKNRSTNKKSAASGKVRKSWVLRYSLFAVITSIITAGIYFYGTFETRTKMERAALLSINTLRSHEKAPAFVSRILDAIYDTIPTSQGLVVEGSELGRNPDRPFIAGIPHSRFPFKPLKQLSYVNLFSETKKQAICIAIRLDDLNPQVSASDATIIIDPQVPQLTRQSMSLGNWSAQAIAPQDALIRQYGARGRMDGQLATNHAPMSHSFYAGIWNKAMHELTQRYPKRFDEVWVYMGPTYRTDGPKLSTGIAIPDAFYAIVLDLTDEGGLRALALLIPMQAESRNLNDYITSISNIEKLTGLQFLPELDYSLRDTISNNICPNVW